MADALSRLPRHQPERAASAAFDLDSTNDTMSSEEKPYPADKPPVYSARALYTTSVFVASTVNLSDDFKERLRRAYQEDTRSRLILRHAEQLSGTPYKIEDGILFMRHDRVDGIEDYWLYVPWSLQEEIFRSVHDDLGHPGYDRGMTAMKGYAIYKKARHFKEYVSHCPRCLENRTRRHRPYETLQPISVTAIPFHTITIDFMVGLPASRRGYNKVLVLVDKATKMISMILGKDTWTASDWAQSCLRFWLTTD